MHHFRFYKTYPATPTPMERRHSSRVLATCVLVGLALCVVAIVILFVFVLQLRNARTRSIEEQQQSMDQAMCSVLREFHSHNLDLQQARIDLHCPPPTGA
jgi:beta-lactamase regulating signal transducer with metallopeptidase domain